jgi:hypothetical protein
VIPTQISDGELAGPAYYGERLDLLTEFDSDHTGAVPAGVTLDPGSDAECRCGTLSPERLRNVNAG